MIDLDSYELIVDGKKMDTPPKELELLYHLASTPNRVYTRNQLLDEVWGFDYFGDSRTVDVHIKRLREKVEGVSDQWALKTVWGVGYKFEMTGARPAEKAERMKAALKKRKRFPGPVLAAAVRHRRHGDADAVLAGSLLFLPEL